LPEDSPCGKFITEDLPHIGNPSILAKFWSSFSIEIF